MDTYSSTEAHRAGQLAGGDHFRSLAPAQAEHRRNFPNPQIDHRLAHGAGACRPRVRLRVCQRFHNDSFRLG